jgi:hypothetical protein
MGVVVRERRVARNRRAVPAQVEQDHLHALAGRSDDGTGVHPVVRATGRIARLAPEVEEDLPRGLLHRIVGTRIVLAVIVVVPGCHHRRGVAQTLEARLGRQRRIGLLEFTAIPRVAIDVVAEEQEEVGISRLHRRPDGLRLVLLGAGSEGDAGQRKRALMPCVRRREGDRRQGEGQRQSEAAKGRRREARHQNEASSVRNTWRGAPVTSV